MDFFIKDWLFWSAETDLAGTAPDSIAINAQWPELSQVPVMQRRRLSPLTKMAFHVALSQSIGSSVPIVFASRHGDLHKTLELLQDVVHRQPLSPTQFALSVHNAIAGQLSIFCQHQAEHSSIAAGDSSLHYAIVEAFAMLAGTYCPEVLVVYADQPVPAVYQCFTQQPSAPAALALLLSNAEGIPVTLQLQSKKGLDTVDEVRLLQSFLRSENCYETIHTSKVTWYWQRRPYVAVY